jgi:SAM-dependent MidA family methyltransferase
MHPLASSLDLSIIDVISREGPIPFDRFQEMALYDPDEGYYNRPGRIGESGDFVTGPSWHPAFARCAVRHLLELGERLGGPVTFVDVGCGEGALLQYMQEALGEEAGVTLAGVERSPVRRALAAQRVPRARFMESLEEPVTGWIFGYELVDALPVRSFCFDDEGLLFERCVGTAEDGGFVFVNVAVPDPSTLLAPLWKRGASFEPEQTFEIRPGATGLARDLGKKLLAGEISLFDYGAPTRALYGPVRTRGTLEAFIGHRVTRDVLASPGSRDITAWVDFSELEEAFREEGLAVSPLMTQSRFLVENGIAEEFGDPARETPLSADEFNERQRVAALFAPGGMGETIRVLAAQKFP